MKNRQPKPATTGLSISDVLFALFKHKWIILLLAALGIGGGAAYFLTRKPMYQSEAKLLVSYVMESDPLAEENTRLTTSGRSGGSVMQSQVAILSSWDLLVGLIDDGAVTPQDILPDMEQPTREAAAAAIRSNLIVAVARGGNILNISYSHPDRATARSVLTSLVAAYGELQKTVYRGTGSKTERVMLQLADTRKALEDAEEKLAKEKAKLGIMSLPDAIASAEAERASVEAELLNVKTELTSLISHYNVIDSSAEIGTPDLSDPEFSVLVSFELENLGTTVGTPAPSPQEGETRDDPNLAGNSNPTGTGDELEPSGAPQSEGEPQLAENEQPGEAEAEVVKPNTPLGMVERIHYQSMVTQLAYLQKRQYELETKFRGGAQLEVNEREMNKLKAAVDKMIADNPSLRETSQVVAQTPGSRNQAGQELISARANIAAYGKRMELLRLQRRAVARRFAVLTKNGPEFSRLVQEQKILEEKIAEIDLKAERAKLTANLADSEIPGISPIQNPSPAGRTFQGAAPKIALGLAAFGIFSGIGLALLMELVLDRRVKRPAELETRMRIPLMMSIPRISMNGRAKRLAMNNGAASQRNGEKDPLLPEPSPHRTPNPLVHGSHFINPYADAIRDRLGYYFELNNMTHKPKLIALTGLSAKAGTSTLAAGLAAAFSEIEDGKVLYVDMNPRQGGEGGEKDPKALLETLRAVRGDEFDLPSDNLHVATVPTRGGDHGLKPFGTKKFYELMPKFRASQFDYIIFDMPPLGSTSPTVAMAGFMDQVILVLDAENTDRDQLRQAHDELLRGNADVTCIFNKVRSHAPKWIEGAA